MAREQRFFQTKTFGGGFWCLGIVFIYFLFPKEELECRDDAGLRSY